MSSTKTESKISCLAYESMQLISFTFEYRQMIAVAPEGILDKPLDVTNFVV